MKQVTIIWMKSFPGNFWLSRDKLFAKLYNLENCLRLQKDTIYTIKVARAIQICHGILLPKLF